MTVECSDKAMAMANRINAAVVIEIQIYFSCMLGKRLAFYCDAPFLGAYPLTREQFNKVLADSQQLIGNVFVRFNTVATKHCPVADYLGPPPVTDFIVVKKGCLRPDLVKDRLWQRRLYWRIRMGV